MTTLYSSTSKRRKSLRRPKQTNNASNSDTAAYQEMVPLDIPLGFWRLTIPKSNKLGRGQKGHGKAWLNCDSS